MKAMKAMKTATKAGKKQPMKAKTPIKKKTMKKTMKRDIKQEMEAAGFDTDIISGTRACILREYCNSVHHLRKHMHPNQGRW
jgi:hypothetical protein